MKFKFVIEDGNKELLSKELNYYELQDYAGSLEDNLTNTEIFKILSIHPSQEVRERIASKDNLDMEVCENFEEETVVNVLRSFVRSDGCKRYSSQKNVVKWISMDVELACSIAGNLERYENIEIDEVVKIIMKHTDPSVLAELAGNSSIPKKYLKELSKHVDSKVSSNARYSMN
jgi:hypothetical protein